LKKKEVENDKNFFTFKNGNDFEVMGRFFFTIWFIGAYGKLL